MFDDRRSNVTSKLCVILFSRFIIRCSHCSSLKIVLSEYNVSIIKGVFMTRTESCIWKANFFCVLCFVNESHLLGVVIKSSEYHGGQNRFVSKHLAQLFLFFRSAVFPTVFFAYLWHTPLYP